MLGAELAVVALKIAGRHCVYCGMGDVLVSAIAAVASSIEVVQTCLLMLMERDGDGRRNSRLSPVL